MNSMTLLALHLSKELVVATNTAISSSLHNEVMHKNHKAASSLNMQVLCCARCTITDIVASFQSLYYDLFTWSH